MVPVLTSQPNCLDGNHIILLFFLQFFFQSWKWLLSSTQLHAQRSSSCSPGLYLNESVLQCYPSLQRHRLRDIHTNRHKQTTSQKWIQVMYRVKCTYTSWLCLCVCMCMCTCVPACTNTCAFAFPATDQETQKPQFEAFNQSDVGSRGQLAFRLAGKDSTGTYQPGTFSHLN